MTFQADSSFPDRPFEIADEFSHWDSDHIFFIYNKIIVGADGPETHPGHQGEIPSVGKQILVHALFLWAHPLPFLGWSPRQHQAAIIIPKHLLYHLLPNILDLPYQRIRPLD